MFFIKVLYQRVLYYFYYKVLYLCINKYDLINSQFNYKFYVKIYFFFYFQSPLTSPFISISENIFINQRYFIEDNMINIAKIRCIVAPLYKNFKNVYFAWISVIKTLNNTIIKWQTLLYYGINKWKKCKWGILFCSTKENYKINNFLIHQKLIYIIRFSQYLQSIICTYKLIAFQS